MDAEGPHGPWVGIDAWRGKNGFVDPSTNDPAAWVICAWLRDDVWLCEFWKETIAKCQSGPQRCR